MAHETTAGKAFHHDRDDIVEDYRNVHREYYPEAQSSTGSDDLEKRASNEGEHNLSHSRTEDQEYIVTPKTWAVVVVSRPTAATRHLGGH